MVSDWTCLTLQSQYSRPWARVETLPPHHFHLVDSSGYVFWQGCSDPKPPSADFMLDLGKFLTQRSKKCYIVKFPKNTKKYHINKLYYFQGGFMVKE